MSAMRAIQITRHPTGPRVWLAGQRVHHGATGLVLVVAGAMARNRRIIVAGVALLCHDRRDWRVWLVREGCPRG